jgi:hypothetical protein
MFLLAILTAGMMFFVFRRTKTKWIPSVNEDAVMVSVLPKF